MSGSNTSFTGHCNNPTKDFNYHKYSPDGLRLNQKLNNPRVANKNITILVYVANERKVQ